MRLEVSAITVPAERQRKELGRIETLAQSFENIGQISPIVVRELGGGVELVAGERRLRAAQSLGWTHIEAVSLGDLDKRQRTLVELEENIRRKQLSWQEEVAAVARYASVCGWKKQAEIAKELCLDQGDLSKMLTVAEVAAGGDAQILEQRTWLAAHNVLSARSSRKIDKMLEEMTEEEAGVEVDGLGPSARSASPAASPTATLAPAAKPPPPEPYSNAAVADFRTWAPEYAGPRFNLLHCDFPYGLKLGTTSMQDSSGAWQRYTDSPELFHELLAELLRHQDRLAATAAHCIFWLPARHWTSTAEAFSDAGWTVFDTPLVWHKSDSTGLASNVRMWPRRTYEMALFAVRGNRQILKPKAASFAAPTLKEFHLSEKPVAVLRHFFEMVVDSSTIMLDPTCGSGTACQVAMEFGAEKVLGLDVQEECVVETRRRMRQVQA